MLKITIKFLFIFLLSNVCFAVTVPVFTLSDFIEDAKFVGTVRLISAKTVHLRDEIDSICAVEYNAVVIDSAKGSESGKQVKFNLLKDAQSRNLSFLEVGEAYFLYAESRDTYRPVQLSDGLHDFPSYPPHCYSSEGHLQIYREFSGKIVPSEKGAYVRSPGLKSIIEIGDLPSMYWSQSRHDFVVKDLDKKGVDGHYQGVLLEPLLDLFHISFK